MLVQQPQRNAYWFRTLCAAGAIRKSADCTAAEVEAARAEGRLLEDELGYWYVEGVLS